MVRSFLLKTPRNFICGLIIMLGVGFNFSARAADLKVKEDKAPLYSTATGAGNPIGYLNKGKVLKSDGNDVNGFFKLQSRSGRAVWIAKKSVEVKNSDDSSRVEDDLVQGGPDGGHKQKESEGKEDDRFPALTYDFGGAFGSTGGANYFELVLGLDTYFKEWISWRNAGFFRRTGSTELTNSYNAYGVDTSVDGHLNLHASSSLAMYTMGGVGYRIANHHLSAPFLEAGIAFKLAGLYIGGGVKYLLNKFVRDDKNDLIFSITLGGGGSL